jgi:gliding motility associated protien GldN
LSSFGQVIGGSSQSSSVNTPRDDIYDHIHTDYKRPIPYSYLRQADVVYSKRIWQIIDFREKMNQAFYYPLQEHLRWKNFITIVMEAIRAGELTAYDAFYGDEFTTPMSISAVEEDLRGIEVVTPQFDENDVYIGDTITYRGIFDPAEVKKLKIKEVWYFDKQRSQLKVRVLGLCPVWEYFDPDTQRPISKDMFWIYFPEARKVLSRAEVFNRKNGAERRTYDDIFWKRMFSSYIYKEENVYDRNINQYATGMEALLESERIKNEIFEVEEQMWEY